MKYEKCLYRSISYEDFRQVMTADRKVGYMHVSRIKIVSPR